MYLTEPFILRLPEKDMSLSMGKRVRRMDANTEDFQNAHHCEWRYEPVSLLQ